MNDLRFVAACLQGEGKDFPIAELMDKSAAEYRKEVQAEFYRWLKTFPQEMGFNIEDNAFSLVSAWADESYERGFIAGMRLMHQVLSAH